MGKERVTGKSLTRRDFLKASGSAAAVAAVTLGGGTITSSIAEAATDKKNKKRNAVHGQIDAVLKKAIETGVAPGVAAMAANKDGIIYEACYGKKDVSGDSPVTPATVFWFASMTKAVTATAAMQLVEKGKLKLDAPIEEVVPELANPQVLEGFTKDGQPQLRPAKRSITLRHLLTHTSGLGYNFTNPLLLKYASQPGFSQDFGDIKSYQYPLLFDPGDRWQYGVSIDWAGRAIEIASGETLADYTKKNILLPLGMKDSGYDRTPAMLEQLSAMHTRLPDGSTMKIPFAYPQKPKFYSGGGGLYGTIGDYLKFTRMLLNDGRLQRVQILQPKTVQMMKQNHVGNLQAGQLKTAMPQFSNDCDFWPGMQQRWGLSFLINTEETPEGRSAGSIAWAGLSNSYYWVDSKKKVCGVIIFQVLPFADPKLMHLFRQFEAGIYKGMCA